MKQSTHKDIVTTKQAERDVLATDNSTTLNTEKLSENTSMSTCSHSLHKFSRTKIAETKS